MVATITILDKNNAIRNLSPYYSGCNRDIRIFARFFDVPGPTFHVMNILIEFALCTKSQYYNGLPCSSAGYTWIPTRLGEEAGGNGKSWGSGCRSPHSILQMGGFSSGDFGGLRAECGANPKPSSFKLLCVLHSLYPPEPLLCTFTIVSTSNRQVILYIL